MEMVMSTEFRMSLGLTSMSFIVVVLLFMVMSLTVAMPLLMVMRAVQQGGMDLRLFQAALGLGREAEQAAPVFQTGRGGGQGGAVSLRFRRTLEPDDVGPRRRDLNFDRVAFHRQAQLPDTVFMGAVSAFGR